MKGKFADITVAICDRYLPKF